MGLKFFRHSRQKATLGPKDLSKDIFFDLSSNIS